MNLDFFLGRDAFSHQELSQVHSVVTLKLNDIAPFFVLDCVTIAAPSFLEMSRQLFHVEVVRQASDRSQTLASITFLEVQMDEVVPSRPRSLIVCV